MVSCLKVLKVDNIIWGTRFIVPLFPQTNINEDCPHRQQLEHTLLHCQTQSEILQATRDNYLSIIEEFQRDLEELTEQVEQQQQQQQQQKEQLEHELTTEHDLTELQHFKDLPGSNISELELQVCIYHTYIAHDIIFFIILNHLLYFSFILYVILF